MTFDLYHWNNSTVIRITGRQKLQPPPPPPPAPLNSWICPCTCVNKLVYRQRRYDMRHEMLTQRAPFCIGAMAKRARWVSISWRMSYLLWSTGIYMNPYVSTTQNQENMGGFGLRELKMRTKLPSYGLNSTQMTRKNRESTKFSIKNRVCPS